MYNNYKNSSKGQHIYMEEENTTEVPNENPERKKESGGALVG